SFSKTFSSKRTVSKKGNPALVITQKLEVQPAKTESTKIVRQVISKNAESANTSRTATTGAINKQQEQIQKYKQQILQQRQEQIQKQGTNDSLPSSNVVIAGKAPTPSSLETKGTKYTVQPKIPEPLVKKSTKPTNTVVTRDDIYFLEKQNFTDYDYFLKYLPEHVFQPVSKEANTSIYTNMRDSIIKKFAKSKKPSDTSFEGKS
ncbi:hypothetical protein M1146_04275, partial [Patescibacteria group bacterium]|nr:hypothetical protein [Patescibacteria group bacterium]